MDNFFRNWFKREDTQAGVPNVPKSTADAGATGARYAKNVVHVGGMGALTIAAWHRAVELRAKTMGQLLFEYQRWDKAGACFTPMMYGEGRHLNWLLKKRPNPLMTATVMMQQAEIDIMTRGNALIYIERDEYGTPRYLWLAMLGGYDPENNTYSLTYATDKGVRFLANEPAANVIHVPNTFRNYGGYLGIPTLTYAANVLALNATLDNQALENAAKGGRMKLMLQQDKTPQSFGVLAGGIVDKKQMKQYALELEREVYDQDVIAVHGATGVTNVQMNAQQLQLFEQRSFEVSEIARITGVPKALLMDDSNSSYKTPEAATEEFMLRTIQPKMQEWEDELDSKLLTEEDFGKRRIYVGGELLRRLDIKGQAEADKLHLETGVKTVNELRRDHNLPRVDAGDVSYVSTNLAEVGSEKLRGGEGLQDSGSATAYGTPDDKGGDGAEGGEG